MWRRRLPQQGIEFVRFKFVTYNILNGAVGREDLISAVLTRANADVIVLQEVAAIALVQRLARELAMAHFVAESNHDRRKVAILSRLPICSSDSYHPFPLHRTLLEARIEYTPGRSLAIFGVHLVAPSHVALFEWWRIWELNIIFGRIGIAQPDTFILAGDFNAVAPGDVVETKVLPRYLRWPLAMQGGCTARGAIANVMRRGMSDAYRLCHDQADGYTIPSRAPNGRLDYIFVNPKLRDAVKSCEVVTEPDMVHRASDHLPVLMELEFDS
jgi:endonuclease/exonuclease/phosphatase family metal-dependent hydrolase